MIKNDRQLRQAIARLHRVRGQIEDSEQRYSGIERELLTIPLYQEQEELEQEISEFQELRGLSLEEAVEGPLRDPTLLDNVGELLAKLRISADLTQEELAARIGWQQSNLSRFESENYHSQTIAKVVEYASALGVWLHVVPSLTERPRELLAVSMPFSLRLTEEVSTTSGEIWPVRLTDMEASDYGTAAIANRGQPEAIVNREPEAVSA